MTGNEHFEHTPEPRPELAAYLERHLSIDPNTVLSLEHIPPLIGGIKSNQFIIRDPEADADTPPDPAARVDLGKVVVAASEMKGFADFFTSVEKQADKQYDIALLETQQALADVAEQGATIELLFVPDSVNSSARGYFTRLTRLAQDTGITVAMPQVDHSNGDAFYNFKYFEPVKAASVGEYWQERETSLSYPLDPAIHLSNCSRYTMESAYERGEPLTEELIDGIALPAVKEPLVFTSFEKLQEDYPGAPISDPALWDIHRTRYTLVGTDAEANAFRRAKQIERDTLRRTMRIVARATTNELCQLFDEEGTRRDKVATIRELANSTNENNGSARMILAKLGDKEAARTIIADIRDRTSKNAGYESLTMAPLGIHMRHDELLFGAVLDEVQTTIEHGDIAGSDTLLSLMGALFHSHDPRIGELLAGYLTAPTQDTRAYASKVLHAMSRWMPEYAMGLAYQPKTEQRNRSLNAIQTQTAAFLDAYNKDQLDGIYQYMFYRPDHLVPLLFWFNNPQHSQVAADSVMRQFKDGGHILTDSSFERTYLTYRRQYGDLPEISKLIRTSK